MTAPLSPPVFDGHNDLLLHLHLAGGPAAAGQVRDGRTGHIDAQKAADGGFGGGIFAVFVPSPMDSAFFSQMVAASYDLPNPPPIAQTPAAAITLNQIATLLELDRRGDVALCTTTAQIRAALADGPMAAVLHIEGAEAIGPDLDMLDVLHAAGLRSLGPVWSRANIFGDGVPFRFPSSPDIGAGLTDLGRTLVRRCNARKILVDLSHLTEKGFWDVAAVTDAPLVATHSNAHALCGHARNLTDRQLDAIAESGGLVGLNFAAAFLREDGRMLAEVPLETMLRHLDHLIGKLGEDGVGFGSDFDGAVVPEVIGSVAGLPALRQAMLDHGFGADLIAKLCHENWLRVLARTWGEAG